MNWNPFKKAAPAAAETPACAAIGRKMARIAREALPEYAAGEREAA